MDSEDYTHIYPVEPLVSRGLKAHNERRYYQKLGEITS